MIKILCDSSLDLSKKLIEEFELTVVPFGVTMGDKEYKDGVDLTPQMIFDHVESTGVLPKTSALNEYQWQEEFEKYKDEEAVICLTISSKASVTYANAKKAAENYSNVYVIDSLSLSSGMGIQAIYARKLARQGLSAGEIVKKVEDRRANVQISFATYKLNYLHKGGRCSSVQLLGANLLKIRPSIIMTNGSLGMHKKYMGPMAKVCKKYVADTLEEFNKPNKELVFITHASATPDIVGAVREELLSKFQPDRLEETVAGATVTSHCGENTIGIIYYNDQI
ncbi:MAG: DegV family protein [Clostridiales bacterium]|nr:DegV family protein [Clostridiales bacterium]